MNIFDRNDINHILNEINLDNLKPFARGGDGNLYKIKLDNMNYVMKILKNNSIKEILVTEYVQKIFSKNIIKLYDYFLSTKDYDNNFMKNILSNKYNLSNDENNNEMKNMIYQISHGLILLNNNNIAHLDTKPKNILFKYFPKMITLNYQTKLIKTRFLFKISDFGKSQINIDEYKSNDDELTEKEFEEYILDRKDLEELSKILERMIVNKIQYNYDLKYFDTINDKKFKKYYYIEKKQINKTLKEYPKKIKLRFFKRSLLYYLIENKMLNMDKIKSEFAYFPNKSIIDILNKLTDNNFDIETIIS